jgi:hypothetical protein
MVTPEAMTAIRDPPVGFERGGKLAHRLDPFHRHHSILPHRKRTIAESVKGVSSSLEHFGNKPHQTAGPGEED